MRRYENKAALPPPEWGGQGREGRMRGRNLFRCGGGTHAPIHRPAESDCGLKMAVRDARTTDLTNELRALEDEARQHLDQVGNV